MNQFKVLSATSLVLKGLGFLSSSICIFILPCSAQKIEVPKGTKVEFAVVGKEAKAPMPAPMSVADFQVRLKQGGTFSLSGGDLVLAPADFGKNTTFFIAVDTLELKNGARIVTNGNTLVVFANNVVSENGGIISFREDERKAADGGQGHAGKPGVPGRLVSFHVIQKLTGILNANLSGQDGGIGGPGSLGKPGSMGVKGDAPVWIALPLPPFCECKKGGGGGGPGSSGEPGGRGGDGGNGGSGGILEFYNVGAAPIPAASYTFRSDPGRPGNGGPGGPGGAGGEGGLGGDGGGCCGGGPRGAQGAPGQAGPPGAVGSLPNAGEVIVKNLELEFIVQHIRPESPLDPKTSVFFKELK